MDDYRSLTEEEISTLERQGCQAEDWTAINVSENFSTTYIRNVKFYGEVNLGVFEKNINVDEGFSKHAGIYDAVLKDVTIGDNCLIERTGNYINNYDIGEECYISNIGKMNTTSDATYGEGNVISVKNESGDGNVILFDTLNTQIAAFQIRYAEDKEFRKVFRTIIYNYLKEKKPERGVLGYRVKIVNTTEITNTIINDDCEISGASRISECSILSTPESSTYIGNNVILDDSIIQAGSSILDGAHVNNCFIGEACHIVNASTESSLFFANSFIGNGETCAALCGPFTVSHHKNSLLIAGEFSFYNAGANTNFSNHAYKMGPIHWGVMERGDKTSSGSQIFWPAHIGAFSMCMGWIQTHPTVQDLPFSYLFGDGLETCIAPGHNVMTVGTYRDIHKWPKRDMRPASDSATRSLVNFDWLSPFVVSECVRGKAILEGLRKDQGQNIEKYNYGGCYIRNSSMDKGIRSYDMIIRLFLESELKKHPLEVPQSNTGTGKWCDLCGLLAPEEEVQRLLSDIKTKEIDDLGTIHDRFMAMHLNYENYKWAWTYQFILNREHLDTLTEDDVQRLIRECEPTHAEWLSTIKNDAKKEFKLGDVEESELEDFLEKMEN